jgi:hypothetical protein
MDFWSQNLSSTIGQLEGHPLLMAAVSFLVGALSKGAIDHWFQNRRLRFERDNARQQKLVDAQSALLVDLGRVCWKFRFDAIRVAYHWRESQLEKYQNAAANYVENCWQSLSDLRFIGTQASWLFDDSAQKAVEKFYTMVEQIDTQIEEAIAELDVEKRGVLFKRIDPKIEPLREQISALILNLARRVNLTPSGKHLSRVPGPPVELAYNGEPLP